MTTPKPPIALTGARDATSGRWQPKESYTRAVAEAGGAPLALQSPDEVAQAAGVLLTGGGDVAPSRYGRPPHPGLGAVEEERDSLEIEVVSEALARGVPLLGVCRGTQVLVVACGGVLWQDVPSELPYTLGHGRGAGREGRSQRTMHRVLLRDGSLAAKAAGATELDVNSSHHQAAQMVGPRLIISGWAPDGIIEAVELAGAGFVLGVQWHPEDLLDCRQHARVFSALVEAA